MCCGSSAYSRSKCNLKEYIKNVFGLFLENADTMGVHPNSFWQKTKPGLGTTATVFTVWIKELYFQYELNEYVLRDVT